MVGAKDQNQNVSLYLEIAMCRVGPVGCSKSMALKGQHTVLDK